MCQQQQQLLPGLPDDLARECLIRLPFRAVPVARSVCHLWRRELHSPYFHRRRKAATLTRPLLAFSQAESDPDSSSTATKRGGASIPSYRLTLFEPATGDWSRLPPVPSFPRGLPLFCRLAAVDRGLIVIGGWDPSTWAASDAVHIFDFDTGSWHRGSPMPSPRRSFFACAAVSQADGTAAVLVAGGHDEEKNALRSALMFDVAANTWTALPDMAAERDECRGVRHRGQFYVVGGYSTEEQGQFKRTAEALDVVAARWEPVDGWLEEGMCPRTCVEGGDGKMYMSGEGGQVAVLEAAGWRTVADVPADARVGPQLVAWEGGLMVMGAESYGAAQVGYVLEGGQTAWKKVVVPEEYSGYIHEACCLDI